MFRVVGLYVDCFIVKIWWYGSETTFVANSWNVVENFQEELSEQGFALPFI